MIKNGSWGKQKPPAGSVVNEDNPITESMVGCFLFNEGAGGVRNIARLSPGTLTSGVTWGAGRTGPALNFNGTSGDVSVAGLPPMGQSQISVVCSANLTTEGDQMLVMRTPVNSVWALFIQGGNFLWRGIEGASFDRASYTFGAGTLVGRWRQYAVTDTGGGAGTGANLFIDNVNVASNANIKPPDFPGYAATSAVHFGNFDASGYWVGGKMDYVYIFNRCLSPNEVIDLYNDPYQVALPSAATKHYSYPAPGPSITITPYYYRMLAGRDS